MASMVENPLQLPFLHRLDWTMSPVLLSGCANFVPPFFTSACSFWHSLTISLQGPNCKARSSSGGGMNPAAETSLRACNLGLCQPQKVSSSVY